MEKKLHPIDRDIIRSLAGLKLAVTPSKIAKTINVHPTTVQSHIKELAKRGIADCVEKGNRLMCKINPKWKKRV
ncbi:MAG: hypothetical protein AABY22_33410 [Nanoarchaeota archaeon]